MKGSGMDEDSALILAGNVGYFLKGQVYKRAISIPATDDYLTWIRRDRNDAGLRKALQALEKHISYREFSRPTICRGLRALLMKHAALLDQPKPAAILMEWRDPESSGYIDVFPMELFGREGSFRGIVHEVRGPGGGSYEAKADLTVRGQMAEFDFTPYPEFNEKNEMLLGTSRILFEDGDRTRIAAVHWKGARADGFKAYPFYQPESEVPPASDYKPDDTVAEKKVRMVRERPGQLAFRRTMKFVYGNRCCVTGCGIPDALEGAHIDGYRNRKSNHVRNGLLLRRDIHALFDRHLLAIDPATYKVQVSPAIHMEESYAALHGRELKRPKEESHHPDKSALERHWKRFCKTHGIS